MKTLLGQGRVAINMIADKDTFIENKIDANDICQGLEPDYGTCAVTGTAKLNDKVCTVIATDGMNMNTRFPVVYAGIIGLEEGYKMASAVYMTIEADKDAQVKRPIILVVDTPGNGPGKIEEIIGMNKSTAGYQLALAEARYAGHPIVAMVIGRAISGAFLCHGLQADRILSLSSQFNTMIHVMPLTSVSRIINRDLEFLESISKNNPVFAAGPEFFLKLGGVEKLLDSIESMREEITNQIKEIYELKAQKQQALLGPRGRAKLGLERNGRVQRESVFLKMDEQFRALGLDDVAI